MRTNGTARTSARWAIAIAALFCVNVEGAVLVSNLAEPSLGGNISTIDMSLWALQSFETDNNAYNLVSIQTVLGDLSGGAVVSGELRDFTTGTLLTTMTVPNLAGVLSVRTLTPDNPVTLDPNTLYALVLGVAGAGSFRWRYAEGQNSFGPGSLFQYAYSNDQGATFHSFINEDPYYLQVNVDRNGAAVPEPSTLALSVSALIAGLVLRRLKRPPKRVSESLDQEVTNHGQVHSEL